MRRKARGRRGSWFAHVDGERYPCVHERFLTGLHYLDPAQGVPLPTEYVQAIAKGTVILTRSREEKAGEYKRNGYIALYRIDEIEFEKGQLSFRLAERLNDLK